MESIRKVRSVTVTFGYSKLLSRLACFLADRSRNKVIPVRLATTRKEDFALSSFPVEEPSTDSAVTKPVFGLHEAEHWSINYKYVIQRKNKNQSTYIFLRANVYSNLSSPPSIHPPLPKRPDVFLFIFSFIIKL